MAAATDIEQPLKINAEALLPLTLGKSAFPPLVRGKSAFEPRADRAGMAPYPAVGETFRQTRASFNRALRSDVDRRNQ